jgi:hypothetical protein
MKKYFYDVPSPAIRDEDFAKVAWVVLGREITEVYRERSRHFQRDRLLDLNGHHGYIADQPETDTSVEVRSELSAVAHELLRTDFPPKEKAALRMGIEAEIGHVELDARPTDASRNGEVGDISSLGPSADPNLPKKNAVSAAMTRARNRLKAAMKKE